MCTYAYVRRYSDSSLLDRGKSSATPATIAVVVVVAGSVGGNGGGGFALASFPDFLSRRAEKQMPTYVAFKCQCFHTSTFTSELTHTFKS